MLGHGTGAGRGMADHPECRIVHSYPETPGASAGFTR